VNLLPAWAGVNPRGVRVFSFGGGVQSHAVLALQALGTLTQPYDVFLFSNVGHDSENPETLEYLDRYTRPFCEQRGIPFIELRRIKRGLGEVTLVQEIFYQQRSIIIPAYFGTGGFGNRNCTTDFKVRVIDRYIRDAGYHYAVVGLGISVDEFSRARSTEWHRHEGQDYQEAEAEFQQTSFLPVEQAVVKKVSEKRDIGFWKKREYPLLDLRLSRDACHRIIQGAGLPMPPKSSCFFCPFKRPSEWIELKRRRPDLFERAVDIEAAINEKRLHLAKDGMFLHRWKRPLTEAVGDQETFIDPIGDDDCDSGYCMI
jgi:hypothetical protein